MAKRKAEWQNNYIAKTYDRVNLTLPKGKKEILQAHAQLRNESLNGLINRALDETLERDNNETTIKKAVEDDSSTMTQTNKDKQEENEWMEKFKDNIKEHG